MKIYAESIAVSVILWTASEATTAEISLKLLEMSHNLLAVSVILWTASEASSAVISLKLLEISQKLFNVSLIVTRFPFYVRRGF